MSRRHPKPRKKKIRIKPVVPQAKKGHRKQEEFCGPVDLGERWRLAQAVCDGKISYKEGTRLAAEMEAREAEAKKEGS